MRNKTETGITAAELVIFVLMMVGFLFMLFLVGTKPLPEGVVIEVRDYGELVVRCNTCTHDETDVASEPVGVAAIRSDIRNHDTNRASPVIVRAFISSRYKNVKEGSRVRLFIAKGINRDGSGIFLYYEAQPISK